MRLFVEAVLEERALTAVWSAGERMRQSDECPERAIRWVKREAMHLTLRFLGELESEQASVVGDALRDLEGGGPLTLQLDSLGTFGGRRPRVLWVGIANDAGLRRLAELRVGLDQALTSRGIAPEHAAFRPHLTLGRVRRQATPDERALIRRSVESAAVIDISARVERVALVESTLFTDGPRYRRLTSVEL